MVVRAAHTTALQQRIVTLRESLARENAQILAEIPLFAPLTSPELIALCRRATVLQVPPRRVLLPHRKTGDEDDEALDDIETGPRSCSEQLEAQQAEELKHLITESAFGLVISGGLRMSVHMPGAPGRLPVAGETADIDASVSGGDGEDALPALLPLARLGRGDTFGLALPKLGVAFGQIDDETAGVALPPGVCMHADFDGATLLCWPRDAILEEEIQKLRLLEGGTSLLERCWISRSPLALCLGQLNDPPIDALLSLLKPMSLFKAQQMEKEGTLDLRRKLILITRGEVLRQASHDAEFVVTPTRGDRSETKELRLERWLQSSPTISASPPNRRSGVNASSGDKDITDNWADFVIEVKLPGRCHTLASFTDVFNDLGLMVREGESTMQTKSGKREPSLSFSGYMADQYHVSMPLQDGQTAEQAAEQLTTKLRAVGSTQMRPGDAVLALSVTAEDGESRLTRMAPANGSAAHMGAAPTLAIIDLGMLGATLAVEPDPIASPTSFSRRQSQYGGLSPSLPALWRRFIACHAPHLLALKTAKGEALKDAQQVIDLAEEALKRKGVARGDAEVGSEWHNIACSFQLYRMRQLAGEAEVGIAFHELEQFLLLGEGGYGVVRLARHRVSGTLYAVKSIVKSRIRRMGEQRTYELLERERQVLAMLASMGRRHFTLTRLICSAHDNEWLRLVMPAFMGGDLAGLLEDLAKPMDVEAVQFYSGCIVLALQQLHLHGIAYRDLKPENILLSRDGWPVLTDFGLVAFTKGERGDQPEQPAMSVVGTPEFMAPEVISGSGHSTDCDWWGLGTTLCELLTLNTPFREVDGRDYDAHQRTYSNILRGKYTDKFTREHYRKLEKRAAALVDGLLRLDPAMRLGGKRRGVQSIRTHPFYWGLSWEALEAQEMAPPHTDRCTKQADSKPPPSAEPAAPEKAYGMGGKKPSGNAAEAALDKIFDFSGWGDEPTVKLRRRRQSVV